jgi:hypothetical protein
MIKMIDFRVVERNVINEYKPMLINNYLIINELNLIPKEVTWLIIENLYHLQNDVQNLYHDRNLINFTDLYSLSLIAIQHKCLINYSDYGISEDISEFINNLLIHLFENFGKPDLPTLNIEKIKIIIPKQCYIFMDDKYQEYKDININTFFLIKNKIKLDLKYFNHLSSGI